MNQEFTLHDIEQVVERVMHQALEPVIKSMHEHTKLLSKHSVQLADLQEQTHEHSKLFVHQQTVLNEHSEVLMDLDARTEEIQEDMREVKITVAHDEKRIRDLEKHIAPSKQQ